jgi:type II secretory pathway pseudopilin PulG
MKGHRRDAGFSLAALIVFVTIASIFIAAAVPVYQMQAKRELEEELIFRGGEYTRAIQKYRAKFGAYPTSIDQLVQTNGLHFLRKAYKDPISGKDFRLLTLNPDGSINGSKVFVQNMNNQPLFGNTSSGAQMGQNPFGSQTQNQQQQPGGFGQPQQPGGFGQPQQPGGGFGASGGATSGTRGFGGFAPPPGQQGQGQQSGQANPQQPQQGGFQGFGVSSGFGSTPTTVGGGQIVGVASDSDKPSIKVYNNRQKYNEWDFVALLNQNGQPNQNPGAGQRGNSNPFQGNNPNSPFQTSPQNQGGAFGGSPFGTGQQSGQNPFGTGTMTPTTPTTPPK